MDNCVHTCSHCTQAGCDSTTGSTPRRVCSPARNWVYPTVYKQGFPQLRFGLSAVVRHFHTPCKPHSSTGQLYISHVPSENSVCSCLREEVASKQWRAQTAEASQKIMCASKTGWLNFLLHAPAELNHPSYEPSDILVMCYWGYGSIMFRSCLWNVMMNDDAGTTVSSEWQKSFTKQQ